MYTIFYLFFKSCKAVRYCAIEMTASSSSSISNSPINDLAWHFRNIRILILTVKVTVRFSSSNSDFYLYSDC